jgi:hypothetical protein
MTWTRHTALGSLIVMCVCATTGCATLFSNRLDDLKFESDPAGAEIHLNGRLIGRTPLTYAVERTAFGQPRVQLRLDGHKTREFKLRRSLAPVALSNTLSTLCWATDAASGAMMHYSPQAYLIELDPVDRTLSESELQRRAVRRLVLLAQGPLGLDLVRGQGPWLDALATLGNPGKPEMARRALLAASVEIVLAPNPMAAFDVVAEALSI